MQDGRESQLSAHDATGQQLWSTTVDGTIEDTMLTADNGVLALTGATEQPLVAALDAVRAHVLFADNAGRVAAVGFDGALRWLFVASRGG